MLLVLSSETVLRDSTIRNPHQYRYERDRKTRLTSKIQRWEKK